MQGPGHPGGPPCPAHPFPGSDFLSHSSSLLGRGPVPQGAEATSEPGRAEGRGCWALCGRFSLCGAQPGPCPPLANPWPMGPASQGRLVGSGPPWPCKSLLVGGQQVVRGSVWRPRPSPRAGWAWTECPTGPVLRAGRRPPPPPRRMGSGTGWAPRQDRRCPLPHPQVKLVGDKVETPRARPTRREGSRLQAQHGGQEWRELSPPPSPLRLFSKPFPGLSPTRTGCGLCEWQGEAGGSLGGSSGPRTAVPASWCVGGGGGAWGAGTQGPYRAAGTSVEPGSCPPHGRQRLGHFSGHGAGAPGSRPPSPPPPVPSGWGCKGLTACVSCPSSLSPTCCRLGVVCSDTPTRHSVWGSQGWPCCPSAQVASSEHRDA